MKKTKKPTGPKAGSAPKSTNEANLFGGMIPSRPFTTQLHQSSTKYGKSTPVTAKRQVLPAKKLKKIT